MGVEKSKSAVLECERVIIEHVDYNSTHGILTSCNKVANRMLDRRNELVPVYEEIYRKVDGDQTALYELFHLIFISAAFWNPEKIRATRMELKKLKQLNDEIYETSLKLANLIDERGSLSNKSSVSSNTHYDICLVLDAAGRENYMYNFWVQEDMVKLISRFDCNYWPSLSEFLCELARDANEAEISASDPMTAAAITGQRGSLVDFLKAFFEGLDQNKKRNSGFIPNDFQLSDNSMATIMNCALELPADDIKDAGYIKRYRQSQREK